MNEKLQSFALQTTLERWRTRINRWGMTGLVDTILTAASPLAPFGAQVLYVSQPVLGLFNSEDQIAAWAQLLEDPDGIEFLRAQLVDTPNKAEVDTSYEQ